MADNSSSNNGLYEFWKRMLDISSSVVLILLFSPVWIIVGILIEIMSPGPVLVEKENNHMMRIGKNGTLFRLYKFRSMMVHADVLERTHPEYRTAYIQKHEDGHYKPKHDPRVTPIGKFIRKYSIDESPQFINVLLGEMSLVGPRPYLPDELKEQQRKFPGTEKYVKEVLTVKPGITGPWQVSGRSELAFDQRIKIDAGYAIKKSIWSDLWIILKTPWAMISAKGAY